MSVDIITTRGELTAEKFTNVPTLQELQELVGGYIRVVPLDGNRQMIVDEEGLLKNKSANQRASAMAEMLIVGDVVVLNGSHRLK